MHEHSDYDCDVERLFSLMGTENHLNSMEHPVSPSRGDAAWHRLVACPFGLHEEEA